MRRIAICLAAVVLGTAVPAGVADGATTVRCKSADLRYPFEPGGPKTFGVFKLRITGGTCTTAHRVARRWMADFELNLLLGKVTLPRSALGFRFTTLAPTEAQSYNERGRRGSTTIRFLYRVPNG